MEAINTTLVGRVITNPADANQIERKLRGGVQKRGATRKRLPSPRKTRKKDNDACAVTWFTCIIIINWTAVRVCVRCIRGSDEHVTGSEQSQPMFVLQRKKCVHE